MVDVPNSDCKTPLHLCAMYNKEDCVYVLLQNHASVNAEDSTKRTPIHLAVMGDYINVLKLLILEPSAEINKRDAFGQTPWHYTNEGSDCRKLIEAHQDFEHVSLISNNSNVKTNS